MHNYLSEEQFKSFSSEIFVDDISSLNQNELLSYDLNCGIQNEYKTFLFEKAKKYDNFSVSKTYVMIHKVTKELIGYFTLSTDIIKLTEEEKKNYNLSKVDFMSMPAIKIGKLAINKNLSNPKKGYGSFAIYLAMWKAFEVVKAGVACRFLTVDADIEYDKNTPIFYLKNGFVINQSRKIKPSNKTISMHKDIFY